MEPRSVSKEDWSNPAGDSEAFLLYRVLRTGEGEDTYPCGLGWTTPARSYPRNCSITKIGLTLKGVLLRSEAEPATTPLVEQARAAKTGSGRARPMALMFAVRRVK